MVDKTKDGLWMSKMKLKKGALRKELHVKEGEKIPAKKLEKATHSKNKLEKKEPCLQKHFENLKNKDISCHQQYCHY